MRATNFDINTLVDPNISARVREIKQSWSPEERDHRAEEGRQRRAELLHLILEGEMDFTERRMRHPGQSAPRSVAFRNRLNKTSRLGA